MGKSKELSIWLGCGYGSIGFTEESEDYMYKFKPLGSIKKTSPVLRHKDASKYYKYKIQLYDPTTGEMTDETFSIYFIGLKDGKAFSFAGSSPVELALKVQSLVVEVKSLLIENERLKQLLATNGIEDFRKKIEVDGTEHARKLTNNWGGMNNQMQNNK